MLFRVLTCLLMASLMGEALKAERPSRRTTQPNFILIVADQLGVDEWGKQVQPPVATPNLDQLSSEGLTFTAAYAGSPAGAAARGTLMTGQMAGHGRIRSEIQEPLLDEDITLAESLRSVGYRSGLIGLWGLGWEGTSGTPMKQGFQEFLGTLDLVHGANFKTPFLWRNELAFTMNPFPGARQSDLMLHWMLRGATNFIRMNEDESMLLCFTPPLPGKDSTHGVHTSEWVEARKERIQQLDSQVGALLAQLKRRQLDTDTLVVLTSVPTYGASLKPTSGFLQGTTPLRTGNSGLYEGNLRVPLVARWIGHLRAGTTNLPVAACDILPTLAQLAGAPSPKGIDGRSLAPLLQGKPLTNSRPALYWESHGATPAQAGRIGEWKAIQTGSTWELYHLTQDPRETTNLAEKNPEALKPFAELFREQSRPWKKPADLAARAIGRSGMTAPTNTFRSPMRTNFVPVGPRSDLLEGNK